MSRPEEDQMFGRLMTGTSLVVAVAIGMAASSTGTASGMQTGSQTRRPQQEAVADLRSGKPGRMGPALAEMVAIPPAE